jgi:hypothetical protein
MRTAWWAAAIAASAACVAWAGPASAQDCEGGACRIERGVADDVAPSPRAIRSSVDAYLAGSAAGATLVGGPGSAGYDDGFWIRGGCFLLKIDLVIQARYEAFRWDDEEDEPSPGGDLSGFSIPRVTLRLSGEAPCCVRWYTELEFGHALPTGPQPLAVAAYGYDSVYENLKEGWIERGFGYGLNVRMGLVPLAATRQLMTRPEHQQFVDVSMASAWIGQQYVGYTDRNRDYGIALLGDFGGRGEFSYYATITNGDGPRTRNVLDVTTTDNLAYSARLAWDVRGDVPYVEGSLNQHEREWGVNIGAWAFAFDEITLDKPHTRAGEVWCYGVDTAVNYGPWSFTGAYNWAQRNDSDVGSDYDGWSGLLQLGFHVPNSPWAVAARHSAYSWDYDGSSVKQGGAEWGFAVNYYVDGDRNKLTLDATWINGGYEDRNNLEDVYAGYHNTNDGDALMFRFQWNFVP